MNKDIAHHLTTFISRKTNFSVKQQKNDNNIIEYKDWKNANIDEIKRQITEELMESETKAIDESVETLNKKLKSVFDRSQNCK